MKILIVRLFPYEININNYNVQEIGLAKALIRKGHQCDIVFFTKGEDRKQKIYLKSGKYITIYWIRGINLLKNGLYGNKIIKLAKNYDIIQSSEYDQIHNLKLRKKLGKKLVIYHGPYFDKFNKGYNLKCKLFDAIFLNKKYKDVKFITKSELATAFLKEKGFKNITTIGVGLDKDNLINNNLQNNKLLYRLKDNEKHLLYIGKIEERRNILFLIKILKELNKNNENIKLVLVGKGNKEYVDKVFEYSKKINIYDKIIYIKEISQNEIRKLYEKCDVFLLPTEYEIFGMVLLEAMYFKIPVITTMNGGSSVLIENKKNGMICNINNIEDWKEKIEIILNNPEIKKKIEKEGYNTIEKYYTWDKLANKFLKTYET